MMTVSHKDAEITEIMRRVAAEMPEITASMIDFDAVLRDYGFRNVAELVESSREFARFCGLTESDPA